MDTLPVADPIQLCAQWTLFYVVDPVLLFARWTLWPIPFH